MAGMRRGDCGLLVPWLEPSVTSVKPNQRRQDPRATSRTSSSRVLHVFPCRSSCAQSTKNILLHDTIDCYMICHATRSKKTTRGIQKIDCGFPRALLRVRLARKRTNQGRPDTTGERHECTIRLQLSATTHYTPASASRTPRS
jgi:hypothetical protein